MKLGVIDLLAVAIVLALSAGSLVQGIRGGWAREWRGEEGVHPDRPPARWPLGLALWRGQARISSLLATALGFAMVALLLLSALDIRFLMYPAAIACAALIGLTLGVDLLARPKWAIAPHLRHQPGAIAEWLGADVESTPPPHELGLEADSDRALAPPRLRNAPERRQFAAVFLSLALVLGVAGVIGLIAVSTPVGGGLLFAAGAAVFEVVRELRISLRHQRRESRRLRHLGDGG